MGRKKSRETRKQKQKKAAFIGVENGDFSQRDAAKRCRMTVSTFTYQFHQSTSASPPKPSGRPPALTVEEESSVVKTLLHFCHREFHLTREDLSDCVELLCRNFTQERKYQLPFVDGRPGVKFLRAFERRYKNAIKFGKASKQENVRFISTNTENLTTYFAEIEAVIRDNRIDEKRMANLEESGVSTGRDTLGVSRRNHYGTRSAPIQQRLVEFTYHHRITMMPVIFANGATQRPVFVFKGKNLPYRTIDWNGTEVIEILADCLPRKSIVKLREGGGIDKKIFIEWAATFVNEIKDLTADGRKVLLLYDAYRSHMSLECLTILEQENVIAAFAIPACTSGTTQPLDVGLFQPWKSHIHRTVQSMSAATTYNKFDLFDLCKILTTAYNTAFCADNIRKGFAKTGLYPFKPSVLLNLFRPHCTECPTVILTPKEMEIMLEEKRGDRRESAGLTPVVLRSWFSCTSAVLKLTGPEAIERIRKKEETHKQNKEEKYRKMVRNDAKFLFESKRRRLERARFERSVTDIHVKLYKEPFKLPRYLRIRRLVAKERALMKKACRIVPRLSLRK